MKVGVATGNPVKIRAAERAFADVFGWEQTTIKQLHLDLDLPEQPIGDAIAGAAIERAKTVQQNADVDFGVGIEAGLLQLPGSNHWMSVQICAIVDRLDRCSMGMGPGYELPLQIRDAVLSGEPLREAFQRLLNREDPDCRGAIYFLSDGLIDRVDLTIQAIRMALIPWISRSRKIS